MSSETEGIHTKLPFLNSPFFTLIKRYIPLLVVYQESKIYPQLI